MNTIKHWLIRATEKLEKNNVPTARLDAELIVSRSIGVDRSWLIAHDQDELEENTLNIIESRLDRRAKHEPLAYIFESQEFYGRDFSVNKSVLIPRPESESIIDIFKDLRLPEKALVVDVGCGSGALGITAKLECPDIRIYFFDIDAEVFEITKSNARKYHIKSDKYSTGDLLEACREEYDVLLCNLPYVPLDYPVNEAAKHEPEIALYSGDDGLDHYRRLFQQLSTGLYGKPLVITESLSEQHAKVAEIAELNGWMLIKANGLAQLFIAL